MYIYIFFSLKKASSKSIPKNKLSRESIKCPLIGFRHS